MVVCSLVSTIIVTSLLKEAGTGAPGWTSESRVVVCYPAVSDQADGEDVVGGGCTYLPV